MFWLAFSNMLVIAYRYDNFLLTSSADGIFNYLRMIKEQKKQVPPVARFGIRSTEALLEVT